MNSILESKLKDIGLGEKEAKVYLAAMDLGPATAKQIAQKASVNRATTYVQIESLTEKGLMSSFDKGKKTFFNAESPERLFRFIEKQKNETLEKENILKETLGELKNVFDYSGERPRVRFFEGKEGLKIMQDDFLKTKDKKIEIIYHRDIIEKIFSEDERKLYYQQRIDKKIYARVLYTGKKGKLEISPLTARLWLPEEKFSFSSDITIYGDKIAFVAFEKRSIGIIIESKTIANTLRTIFNLTWETAEKYNKKV